MLLAGWALLWLLVLAATSESPPIDNAEQLTWVRALQWGYYKHPPLPTALLWPLVRLFGVQPEVTYVLGATLSCLSLWLTWRLVRSTSGPRMAMVALLACLCVTYYNGRLHYFNHNTVLMVFVTAAATVSWRLFRAPAYTWWAALGFVAGLGALAKYQMVLVVLPVTGLWLLERGWRQSIHRRGPWLALLVAAALFAPHAHWLWTHDFAPLHYASQTSLGAGGHGPQAWTASTLWLADQLFNRAAPAWLMVLPLAWRAARRSSSGLTVSEPAAPRAGPALAWFWVLWGGIPLLVMWFMGLVGGVALQPHWGTAFLALTTAAAVHAVPAGGWRRVSASQVLKAFAAVQALLLAWNCAGPAVARAGLRPQHVAQFPSQALAQAVAAQARPLLGGSIHYVAGPALPASQVALRLDERPLVLVDGRADISPWVDEAQARRDGVLWLGALDKDAPPPGLQPQPLGIGLWWAVQPGQHTGPSTGELR